ncbi:MAG: hypothetical protein PVG12_01625 [Gammaproteobacteria bacterium]|jgi:hypothetical protein
MEASARTAIKRAGLDQGYRQTAIHCDHLAVSGYQIESIIQTGHPGLHPVHVRRFFETFVQSHFIEA